MSAGKSTAAIDIARRDQARAVDATTSAWVSASAGSGKTTVLTNRVLSLLLSGVQPQRILCLTFTKAAAAEMANRIRTRLGAWVTSDETKLINDIVEVWGKAPANDELTQARRLFAQVLDAPGGLRIETIHAFCQSLLRRFPIEAGISPQFELIDDRAAAEALQSAQDGVVLAAASGQDPQLSAAMAFLTGRLHESSFTDVIAEVNTQRTKFERLFERHGGLDFKALDRAVAEVRATLNLTPGQSRATLIEQACSTTSFDAARLRRAVVALSGGTKADQERARVIGLWLSADADRVGMFDDYCAAFLTQTGKVRDDRNLATQNAQRIDADVLPIMRQEGDRLKEVQNQLASVATAEATKALLTVARATLANYHAYKSARALLDYDDLIQTTRRLLEADGRAAWVLYKLDGGIDHVLVDEAQDTNPDQWAIVGALTQEFFVGEGRYEDSARPTTLARTVFAVGDRKQSIYSFQGADPNGFEAWSERFKTRVSDAMQRWTSIQMNVSFRSTESVLKAVDAVFNQSDARIGVLATGDSSTHLAAREGQAGRVELWPLVAPRSDDQSPPWKPPVERVPGDSPQARLAQLIAERISTMVNREVLHARGRNVKPGDIMVLVRKRTPFVDELVRQLKARRIPVAGVDRMKIPQQLAVMDLMALGDFLLLPSDSLTLATVLKSPLVGLTEEQLFDLAHARGDQSLWSALCVHAGADNIFGKAHGLLEGLLDRTDFLGPYALFSHVLVACDGRRKAMARLGFEAEDPIDEFLALALTYEKNHPPSLQGFLQWIRLGDIEIKRDLEQGGDAVRVMTAHGAKGLQAPIVFLPDTVQTPTMRDTVLWTDHKSPVMLWVPKTGEADSFTTQTRDNAKQKQLEEYRRLLYVAMTRAEDTLILCGWAPKKGRPEQGWYETMRRGLSSVAKTETSPFLASQNTTESSSILVIENSQTAGINPQRLAHLRETDPPLPAWAETMPNPERVPPQPLAPSRATRQEPAAVSPTGESGRQRFQRGLLIHKLLQVLPDVPATQHAKAIQAYLDAQTDVPPEIKASVMTETLAVLQHPQFAPLFGPGSLPEVPVVGLVGHHAVSGQVDRLLVTDQDVWIIDYKTNRPPPREVEKVDEGYVYQLAVYRDILKRVYPDHQIRAVLLWTDGPFMMEIPAPMMDAALVTLANEVAA